MYAVNATTRRPPYLHLHPPPQQNSLFGAFYLRSLEKVGLLINQPTPPTLCAMIGLAKEIVCEIPSLLYRSLWVQSLTRFSNSLADQFTLLPSSSVCHALSTFLKTHFKTALGLTFFVAAFAHSYFLAAALGC